MAVGFVCYMCHGPIGNYIFFLHHTGLFLSEVPLFLSQVELEPTEKSASF